MIVVTLVLAVCPPDTLPPDCRLFAERFYQPNSRTDNPCVQFSDGTGGCLANGTLYRTPGAARFLAACSHSGSRDPFVMDWIDSKGRYHPGERSPTTSEVPVPNLAELRLDTLESCSAIGACGRLGDDQLRCWTRFNAMGPFRDGEVNDLALPAAMEPFAWDRVHDVFLGMRLDTRQLGLWYWYLESPGWTEVELPPLDALSVQFNGLITCVQTRAHALHCWEVLHRVGSMSLTPIVLPESMRTGVQKFALGSAICVLDFEGGLTCADRLRRMKATPPGRYRDVFQDQCAIREPDGEVVCWEYTGSPRLGYWVDVKVDRHACALRQSGWPMCWRWGQRDGLEDPKEPMRALAVGHDHTCGITDNQETLCWGNDAFGQLRAPDVALEVIDAGGDLTCGLDGLGRLTCWGDGPSAPLLDEGPFVDVSVTRWRVCGERPDGQWRCQAIGPFAGLDDGAPFGPYPSLPNPPGPPEPWRYAEPGDTWTSAPEPPEPRALWPWSADTLQVCGLDDQNLVRCHGRIPFPSLPDIPLSRVDIGGTAGCGIDADRQIVCFGYGREARPYKPAAYISGVLARPGKGPKIAPIGPVPEWDVPPPIDLGPIDD